MCRANSWSARTKRPIGDKEEMNSGSEQGKYQMTEVYVQQTIDTLSRAKRKLFLPQVHSKSLFASY